MIRRSPPVPRTFPRHKLVGERSDVVAEARIREVLVNEPPAGVTHGPGPVGVAQPLPDRRGGGIGGVGVDPQACLSLYKRLRRSSRPPDDDREAGRCRLKEHETEPLALGVPSGVHSPGECEDRGRGVRPSEVLATEQPGELDSCRARSLRQPFQARPVVTVTHDQQLGVRELTESERPAPNEGVDALVLPAGIEDGHGEDPMGMAADLGRRTSQGRQRVPKKPESSRRGHAATARASKP